MSEFWHTTLSTIRRGDPDWQAIASYEGPIRRYLARRYGRLGLNERDDLLQEILLAMRERVIPRYDAGVGPFRSFLSTAIRNAVIDHYRRTRPTLDVDLEAHRLEAPDPDEAQTIDLEARLLRAVRGVHDRYARGPDADLSQVYVLSGALVDRLSNKEIANREGLSVDQVKRKLQHTRGEILTLLFQDLLPGSNKSEVTRCADLARSCLRTPRKEARLLEDEPQAEVVAAFTRAVREAPRVLKAEGSSDALDLMAGMHSIFQ
ncbi:MAG: sigma-70 family RNA polymerase sigma factor [Planctomycetes bacterium]|nr:sigma-70 family RNA polymerase sigma factor [Planctomycetota bacterium]